MEYIYSVKNRVAFFDYLRVFACFGVVMIHSSAQNWAETSVNSFDWNVLNIYGSISRWSVPIFAMISGAIFLNRDIPIKKLYSKYVLKIAIVFVIWSLIYAVVFPGDIKVKLGALISGHYHMWFLLMIIGMYMCVPIFKMIVSNINVLRYFLLLSFLFAFLLPELMVIIKDFSGETVISIFNIFQKNINYMNMNLVMGFSGYFLLGYYLNTITITKNKRMVIYALGLCGAIFTILMNLIVALKTNEPCQHYCGYITLNVLLQSVAIFVWFKNSIFNHDKCNKVFSCLSKYCLGIYLIHVGIIAVVKRIGLNTLTFNPIICVPIFAIVVFVISLFLSLILNCIPFVKKWVV